MALLSQKYGTNIIKGETGIMDSGASGHYMPLSYKGTNELTGPIVPSIDVRVANGDSITLQATDKLNLPMLPAPAWKCNKFRALHEPLMSVSQLSTNDCGIHFVDHEVVVHRGDISRCLLRILDRLSPRLLTGHLNTYQMLYEVPLQHAGQTAPTLGAKTRTFTAANAYEIPAVPKLIQYLHAIAGFPTKRTWIKAIKNNFFLTWPGLTTNRITKHLKPNKYTTLGHLQKIRQGIHSTSKPKTPRSKVRTVGSFTVPFQNMIAMDIPGRYPITLARGHKYVFILYDFDANYILCKPLKSRTAKDLLLKFQQCYARLKDLGFTAQLI